MKDWQATIQEKPPALLIEHPALKNIKISSPSYFYGSCLPSQPQLNPYPIRVRNTVYFLWNMESEYYNYQFVKKYGARQPHTRTGGRVRRAGGRTPCPTRRTLTFSSSRWTRSGLYGTLPVLRIRDVYPGSRILIFTHPGSRIPDPKSATKERDEKNMLSYLFLKPQISQNWKLFYFWNAEENKKVGPVFKEL